MFRIFFLVVLLAIARECPAQMGDETTPDVPGRTTWAFHADRTGEAPDDFKFSKLGHGANGRWRIRSEKGAPSGSKFLSQLDSDPAADRWCIANEDGPTYGNATLDVMIRLSGGKTERSCGLVFRYKGPKEFYALRADALRGEISLSLVKDGKVTRIESKPVDVPTGVWKELRVDASEDLFEIFFDNKSLFECRNGALGGWGPVGLFTRADTTADFDDLTANPAAPRR